MVFCLLNNNKIGLFFKRKKPKIVINLVLLLILLDIKCVAFFDSFTHC
jgi:hypothetical protein